MDFTVIIDTKKSYTLIATSIQPQHAESFLRIEADQKTTFTTVLVHDTAFMPPTRWEINGQSAKIFLPRPFSIARIPRRWGGFMSWGSVFWGLTPF
jgi:hypothetical protein